MAPTPRQADLIRELKTGRPELPPILGPDGSAAGKLVPVTHRLAENEDVVDALFRWRRDHMAAFLTVFAPTLEKTKTYLTAFSLPDPARVLFLLTGIDCRLIGHIGLCNIAADGAELDNVLRGEAAGVPDFMPHAHRALLAWAFPALDLPVIYLNVLAANARAIGAYRKIGFTETCRTPLMRHDTEDGYRLLPAPQPSPKPAAAMLVRMEIRRDFFISGQLR